MKFNCRTLALILLPLTFFCSTAAAFGWQRNLKSINRKLLGQVVDHTNNHGKDQRIWSAALKKRRDLYVYLPPGFDPKKRYPVMMWLHGLAADEWEFVEFAVPRIDRLIACGKLPPFIIAIPDGTHRGRPGLLATHTSFLNTRLGRYEDYLMCDVWGFVVRHYPIRPEREAHILGGVSMGGGSAYHHAIKRRKQFASVLGLFPPLNVRWVDCRGRYFGNFDPNCWGWRNKVWCGHEPVGKFYGIIKIPIRRLVYPLYGRGRQAVEQLSRNNPIEMLDYYNVRKGELAMFVAYGGRDEFNLDAQIESFLYRACRKNLRVTVAYDPKGRHNRATATKFFPAAIRWLRPRLAPYSPPLVLEMCPQ